MKRRSGKLQHLLAGAMTIAGMAWSMASPSTSRAANKPTPLRVGQTAKLTLEPNSSFDYSVPLGKGT